ncbi:unnamed protein product [Anisakis simplex]|uniref:Protein sidekick homolog (inferred by orthology to a C. elegans protein) n=1 Tax=Anisakis simplex TaxID=6269 RepID=A0A158PNY7_ANISI|nr:unnamed protein product [Anisakis simplex]
MVYISSLWHLLLVHCIYELCAYAAVAITKPPILTQWDSSDELHLAEGDPLTLRCPIKSSGADSFRWFKDGKPLKEASNNSQLYIPFLTANHTAAYRCFTQNQYGAVISSPVLVYVLYINGFLLDEDDEVRVGSGNAFILRAPPLNASSHLNLSWKWFFEDAEIVINYTHYITSQGDLLVTDSTSRFGAYRCLVSANGHTFNSPVQYVLQGERFNERSTAGEFSSSFGIIYSPLDATYRVGDSKSVDFDCVPSRWDNDVSIEWQLNGVSLEEDNDNIKLSNGRRKLSIESPHLIAQNDNALITCTAIDHLSQQTDSVDAQLHIIRRPVIDRSAFRRKVSQSEGHAIKLPCSVVGVPEPTVHWYRNGVLLSDNSSTLVIPSSNDQVSSVYECEAQNEAGFDIASVWVTKIANDFMADDSSVSSLRTTSSLAPLIVNGPSNQSVNSGDEVTLVCKASGHPIPSVVWKHNGSAHCSQLLTNTKYTIDDHSLRILSLTPSDSGEYSCTASNENGNDRASAFVSVIGLDLIEFGPTNQSILIGSNIIMPCSINRKYGSNDGLVASWKWNHRLLFVLIIYEVFSFVSYPKASRFGLRLNLFASFICSC